MFPLSTSHTSLSLYLSHHLSLYLSHHLSLYPTPQPQHDKSFPVRYRMYTLQDLKFEKIIIKSYTYKTQIKTLNIMITSYLITADIDQLMIKTAVPVAIINLSKRTMKVRDKISQTALYIYVYLKFMVSPHWHFVYINPNLNTNILNSIPNIPKELNR